MFNRKILTKTKNEYFLNKYISWVTVIYNLQYCFIISAIIYLTFKDHYVNTMPRSEHKTAVYDVCVCVLGRPEWSIDELGQMSIFVLANFFCEIYNLTCCWWATLVSFEHGWSYRKNCNAGKFVLLCRFIHKNFRLVRVPVFCSVSGFCTYNGCIKIILI